MNSENKILYLIGALNTGGKERLLLDVLSQGTDCPFDTITVYRKKGDLEHQFLQTGTKICYFPSESIISFFRQLRRLVRSDNVSLIHAQSSYDAFLAWIATIGLRTPILQTIHGYEIPSKRLGRIVEQLMFRICRRTVCVSNQQKDHFVDIYKMPKRVKNKISVVYNGIDFSQMPDPKTRNHVPIKMAMVGNFVSEKNQLYVCRFLQKLYGSGIDFDFLFIGSKVAQCPDRYDECVRFCNDNGLIGKVHFLGRRNDVYSILADIDAFIYCSRSETFGLAVIESVAMGIPTFVNDLLVFKEITVGGKLAHLYSSQSVDDLYHLFVDFLSNKDTYQKSALGNAAAVRHMYSIQNHLQELNNLYNSIV